MTVSPCVVHENDLAQRARDIAATERSAIGSSCTLKILVQGPIWAVDQSELGNATSRTTGEYLADKVVLYHRQIPHAHQLSKSLFSKRNQKFEVTIPEDFCF